MENINLVPCDNLETLAKRFNEELEKGRAIRFHNNGGVFAKDPDKNPFVYIFKLIEEPVFGVYINELVEWESDFFRPGKKGESCRFPNLKIEENWLVYGTKRKPFGISRITPKDDELDSPRYGPVSGILRPTEVNWIKSFEGIDRIYWKKN